MKKPRVPEKGCTPSEASIFFDDYFNRRRAWRAYLERNWNMFALYTQGRQWLEPALGVSANDRTYTNWRDIRIDGPEKSIPMPVHNVCGDAIQNEAARLFGVGSRPYVRPDQNDAQTEAAVQVGRDVLIDWCEEQRWNDKQATGARHAPEFGQWIQWSYVDIDWTKLTTVPVLGASPENPHGAVKCSGCDTGYQSPMLSPEHTAQLAPQALPGTVQESRVSSINRMVPDTVSSRLAACPGCGNELKAWQPTLHEVQKPDPLGRPLHNQLPLVDVVTEVVSPHSWFPESGGVETNMETMSEFGFEIIRSLDYIAARYPQHKDDLVAESPAALYENHPIMGGELVLVAAAEGVLNNHARVRYWYQKPTIDTPMGRYMVMAPGSRGGPILLQDDYFLIKSQERAGETIPRCHVEAPVFEEREKTCYGVGFFDLGLRGMQDSINLLLSQNFDITAKWLSPKLLVRDGIDITFSGGLASGAPADTWTYTGVSDADRPEMFGNSAPAQQVWQAFDRLIQQVKELTNQQSAEIGALSPGQDLNYSALQFAALKAGERRRLRIERFRNAKKRMFSWVLKAIHELYREERYYRVRGKDDRWSIKSFRGADLLGQTNVALEDEPVVESSMAERAAINQGIQFGTISITTAGAKRKVNRILKIPLDINEDQNKQVEKAEREWVDWLDPDEDGDPQEPAVDRRAEDHIIHYQQHELDLMSEQATELQRKTPWSKVKLLLFSSPDAEDKYKQVIQQQAQLKALAQAGPQMPPREQLMMTLQKAPPEQAQALLQEQKQNADAQWKQQVDGLLQAVQQYPKAPELVIFGVWQEMLKASGIPPTAELLKLLRFKAHALGHSLESQAQQAQAAMGVMNPSGPGGAQDPAGNVPGPGSTVTPGPGMGGEMLPGAGAPRRITPTTPPEVAA